MTIPVGVSIQDQNGSPVENMAVSVYDSNNAEHLSTEYTDAAGDASFTLPGGTYYLRFYGKHILTELASPQRIRVRTPPPDNDWVFEARRYQPVPPPDPAVCRCWGHFVDAAKKPDTRHMLRLIPVGDPAAANAAAVIASVAQKPLYLAPDADGKIEVDLYRGGLYQATMSGYLDSSVQFRVPDSGTWNLIDLLFPVPESATFDPPGPVALAVGASALFDMTLTMSDGRDLSLSTDPSLLLFVLPEAADPDVVDVTYEDGQLKLVGKGAGATTVSLTVLDTYVYPRQPANVLTVTPISVTV